MSMPQQPDNRVYVKGLDPQYTRWIQDPDSYLTRLELDLRGLAPVTQDDGTTKFLQFQEPKLNEDGIRTILTQLRPILSPNVYMSYVSKDRVYTNIGEIMLDINDLLHFNRKTFEIKSLHEVDEISMLCGNYVEYAILRAREGAERDTVAQINPENREMFDPNMQQGSILSAIWPFGRRR